MGINYNPFAFHSAQRAWRGGGEENLLTRSVKTAFAAAKDILVVNPKNLTLGNYNKFSAVGDAALSTKQEIAAGVVIGFGAFYTCMLYGSTVNLFGRCALSLGCQFGMASLVKTGLIAKKLGNSLFLTGAVSAYCSAYVLPKKIYMTLSVLVKASIPKIHMIAHWVFQNILQPLWSRVLVPAAHFSVRTIRVIGAKLVVAAQSLGRLVSEVARKLLDYVLVPIWNKALAPLGRSIGNAMRVITAKLSIILKPVTDLLSKVVNPVFKYVLEPLWKKALSPCWRGVVKASQWVFHSVIHPFYTKMMVPAMQGVGRGCVYLKQSISHAVPRVCRKVVQSAQWVFISARDIWIHSFLKTARNVVYFSTEKLTQCAQYIVNVSYQIFKNWIVPASVKTWGMVVQAGRSIGNYVTTSLVPFLKRVVEKIGVVFASAWNRIVPAVAEKTQEVVHVVQTNAAYWAEKIQQAMAGIWGRIAVRS